MAVSEQLAQLSLRSLLLAMSGYILQRLDLLIGKHPSAKVNSCPSILTVLFE